MTEEKTYLERFEKMESDIEDLRKAIREIQEWRFDAWLNEEFENKEE